MLNLLVIDGQDDFKRVYYGDLLWKNLVLSSINYASAIWVPGGASDTKRIESLQYQMARSILKAPRNTPLECLLGDLGWQPITLIQNKLRIKYLNRLRHMHLNRWPKLVFNAMYTVYNDRPTSKTNSVRWKWLSHIENALVDCGMDHIFKDNLYNSRYWINHFTNISIDNSNNKWSHSATLKSSLNDYVLFKSKPSLEDYLLCNLDFNGATIKFRARSNTLQLNGRVHSWNPDINISCPLCGEDKEDLRHFLFLCSALNSIRCDEFRKLENQLYFHNLESFWTLFISGDLTIKMSLMLGLSDDSLIKSDDFNLLPTFDVFCKSCLKRAWTARTAVVNLV
jgi:hypothetical protein